MIRRLVILSSVMALGAAIFAPASQANLAITKWESLTCKENKDLPATPPYAVPEVGYEIDAARADGTVHLGDRTPNGSPRRPAIPTSGSPTSRWPRFPHPPTEAGGFPTASSKTSSSTRRKGSASTPRPRRSAPIAQLVDSTNARPTRMVGINYLTVAAQSPTGEGECRRPANACRRGSRCRSTTWCRSTARPSMVGFLTEAGPTFIVGSLDPVDQHVTFTISDIHPPPGRTARRSSVAAGLQRRSAGDGTYLTMPSNCAGGQISNLFVDSQRSAVRSRTPSEAKLVHDRGRRDGLRNVPFKPTIDVAPQGGASTRRKRPRSTSGSRSIPTRTDRQLVSENGQSRSCRKGWASTRPPPTASCACTDAQFGKGTERPDRLPGRVEDRHRRGADPVAAGRLADRHRLRRRAAQERAGSRAPANSSGSSSTPARSGTGSTCA